MVAKRDSGLSVEEFLALDRESLDQKYEYRNGQMIAMAGGSKHHGMLIANTHALLHQHLKSKPCFAFVEMTLKLEDECLIPDLMVTCNEEDLAETENSTYIEHPKLVIEVLSPSTEKDDRGDKFLKYTFCSSIQEYVLINYECTLIQTYTKNGLQWIYMGFMQGQDLELNSIDLTVPVQEIYDRVALPPFDPLRKYRKQNRR